jgi:hypothetical protein
MTSHLRFGTAFSAVVFMSLSLTACAAEVREGSATEPINGPTPTSATPSPTKQATPSPSPSEAKETVSVRGNLLGEVGDTAVIQSLAEDTLAEFTVNSITLDPKCTAPRADEPENGHFLVLDVDVETQQGMEETLYGEFQMNPYFFKMIDEDGKTDNAEFSTGPAYECFPEDDMLPQMIGDAERASGKVVLDTDVESGTLVFEFDQLGWEWEY